ncbi:MAG: hypothetical protein V1725_02070 [archaeon]
MTNNIRLNHKGATYTAYSDKIISQMPLLKEDSCDPISFAELMRVRLEALSAPKEIRDSWWRPDIYTGDAMLYHPDYKIKLVRDAYLIRELNAKSEVFEGQIVLPEFAYEQTTGVEFDNEFLRCNHEFHSLEEVLDNPLWNALARDPELLKKYATAVFKETNERHPISPGSNRSMPIHFGSFYGMPTLVLMRAGGVQGCCDADAGNRFDFSLGKLIGVKHYRWQYKPDSNRR